MKNAKHLLGYLVAILLTFYVTKTYFCPIATTTIISNSSESSTVARKKAPKQIISLEDASELYQSYTTNRACPIELIERTESRKIREQCGIKTKVNPEFIAARSAYLSTEYLNSYLKYTRQETKNENLKITGYRFYFGNYPDKKKFDDGRHIKSPGKNTFFFAPTIYDKKRQIHVGITFISDSQGNLKPQILEDHFAGLKPPSPVVQKPVERNAAGFFFTTTALINPSLIGNDVGSYP